MTKRRKASSSRGGFDYATYSEARGFHRGANPNAGAAYYGAYTMQPYTPAAAAYHPVYNGYLNSGYGTWYSNAYGADGFQYMRGYDPSYDAFYTEGPTVDEKWRSTYPYVPTSYLHQSGRDRSQVGAGSGSRSRGHGRGGGDASEMTETDDGGGGNDSNGGRDFWGSQWEFLMAVFGLSAGFQCVLNFPFVAYHHGKCAFLVAYGILLVLIGIPMYLMEVTVGQFSALGPLQVWKNMLPLGRGIGLAMCLVSLIQSLYYNVIMGYSLYYLFTFPWNIKTNPPAAPDLVDYWRNIVLNITQAPVTADNEEKPLVFHNAMIGDIKWDLSLTLLLSWIVVFACLSRSIKSLGKVIYLTVSLSFAILVALLIQSILLEGSNAGIEAVFEPKWEELKNITTWSAAAHQMFISLSLSFGSLMTYSSYNKFTDKVHYSAFIIPFLNFGVSIMASVTTFSFIGQLKLDKGLGSIDDVLPQSGLHLAFITCAEAIFNLEISQLWSVLFYLMLFLMGLNAVMAQTQTILTGLYDLVGVTRGHYKTLVSLILCCICYLLSIPCVSFSGQYVFDLIEKYGLNLSIFWIAIFETLTIMWIYGVKRFADDLRFMLDHHYIFLWKVLWALAPLGLITLLALSCYTWTEPNYYDSVTYPNWAHGIGWSLTLIVAIQIPFIALVSMIYYTTKRNFSQTFQPTTDWGPGDNIAKQEWINFQYSKALRCKQHPYGYDNYAMNYSLPYYNNAFHM